VKILSPSTSGTPTGQSGEAGKPRCEKWILRKAVLITSEKKEGEKKHMGVSENSGTPKIIHFNRDFHYKSSILGYLYFWKPPYEQ